MHRTYRKATGWVMAAVICVLVGIMVSSVRTARQNRNRSANNLHKIGIAMNNYLSTYNVFPTRAVFDKNGRPLLSWRVRLVPFLDSGVLYDQFRFDEPWDSANNRALIARMPSEYANPNATTAPGMTTYLAVCGKGLAFEGKTERKLAHFQDGTSNTITVVEVDPSHAVPWTKPDDWEYNAKEPMAGLGHAQSNAFHVLFADGAVRLMHNSIDPQAFHAMLTIDGKEPVGAP